MAEIDGDLQWYPVDDASSELWCSADGVAIDRAKYVTVSSKPVLVELYGLTECHKFAAWKFVGCGEGDHWNRLRCGGEPLLIDNKHPELLLIIPGRYKIQFVGCCDTSPVDDVILVRTPVSSETARLIIQQRCCCPHTGELDCG